MIDLKAYLTNKHTEVNNTCPFLLVVLFVVRDGVGAERRRFAFFRGRLSAINIIADGVRLLGHAWVQVGLGWAGWSRSLTFADIAGTGGMQR